MNRKELREKFKQETGLEFNKHITGYLDWLENISTNELDRKIELIKEKLKACAKDKDIELAHIVADDCLCEILVYLGHKDVVDIYNSFDKWYA